MKNYTIISGTGRAGTTLLVRILMKAGIDAGFDPDAAIDPIAHAGLEMDLRNKPDCRLVKSPWIAAYIDEVIADNDIKIDHAIICMRNLNDAAESRRRVQRAQNTDQHVAGGLWGISDPAEQEAYLAEMFHRLLFTLSENGVPMTFLHFPRFANDVDYFVENIQPIFPDVSIEDLRSAYHSTVAPELINDFSKTRPPATAMYSKSAAAEASARAHREKLEAELATLTKLVSDQHAEVALLAAQTSQITLLSQALDRRDLQNSTLSRDVAAAWARIAELDHLVADLQAGKQASETALRTLQSELQAGTQALGAANQQLHALFASHSWRLTRPLRVVRRAVARLRRSLTAIFSLPETATDVFGNKLSGGQAAERTGASGIGGLPGLQNLAASDVQRIAATFDRAFYLAAYPDIAAGGIDPLEHYMSFGWKEGRNPTPSFSTSFYLETSPDVRAADINPFVHWVLFGSQEHRPTMPALAAGERQADAGRVAQPSATEGPETSGRSSVTGAIRKAASRTRRALGEFYEKIIVDHEPPVAIKTVEDFKKTDVSYEQRIINENWTFDTKPRDENTGNEIAPDNMFVYKYLLLERKLSAYKGMDYWDFIRHVVNSRDYTRILSVGSGPCAVEMEIAEKFTKPYVIDCLDLNEKQIQDATRRAQQRGMNLRPVVADLNEIVFEEKYDLVIICAALHHFVELEAVLERLHGALNDTGMFVTYEPVMRNGMYLFRATRVFLGLLFLLLPARLRINHQDYPGEKRVDRYYNEYDRSGWTFESIRSGEIPGLLPKYFKTIHFGRGMTFLRRVSDSIYGCNYRMERRRDRLIVNVLCGLDRFMRATRLLRPEGLFYIGSRRDRPKPI